MKFLNARSAFKPSFLTCTCRGLLLTKPSSRKRNLARLRSSVRNVGVVALQEVHGSPGLFESNIGSLRNSFHIVSDIPWRGSGGVAFFVRKTCCSSLANIDITPHLVSGRIARLQISDTSSRLTANCGDDSEIFYNPPPSVPSLIFVQYP